MALSTYYEVLDVLDDHLAKIDPNWSLHLEGRFTPLASPRHGYYNCWVKYPAGLHTNKVVSDLVFEERLQKLYQLTHTDKLNGFVPKAMTQRCRKYTIGIHCPQCHQGQVASGGLCRRCYGRNYARKHLTNGKKAEII